MANKKTKETNKSKKTTSKQKTTKKETVKLEDQKVVENIEIKEEEKPVVVEKVVENTVEEVNEVNENKEVLDNAEIADNNTPEPTEEQISEIKEMANRDDEKFEYAQSMMDNVQKVTQQEETNECNDVLNETPKREEQIDAEENGKENANCQTNEAEEYKILVDEYGSNVASVVSQGASSQTCIEEKQVQELAEETKQEEKSKKKRRFGFMYRWFGAQIDL